MVNQYSLSIKKAGKLLLILKISVLLLLGSATYAQKKVTKVDSLTLKKELDAVLSKYGLKSKGFAVNVISINQKGGQTAYSITNNYYRDTNYIPDSLNFDFSIKRETRWDILSVYPKYGIWVNPFILFEYDTTKSKDPQSPLFMSGMSEPLPKYYTLPVDGRTRTLIGNSFTPSISKNLPMKIRLYHDQGEDVIIGFGDYADENKSYVFYGGKIFWIPRPR